MEFIREMVTSIFSADSIWSVVARGILWFIVATVIIVSTDNPDARRSTKTLKSNLGFLVIFLVLSTGLVYLLFSQSPA